MSVWWQYLRLELLFLEKMILRRQVLGLPIQTRTAQEVSRVEAEKKAIQAKIAAAEEQDFSSDSDDSGEEGEEDKMVHLAANDDQEDQDEDAEKIDADADTHAATTPAGVRGHVQRATCFCCEWLVAKWLVDIVLVPALQ